MSKSKQLEEVRHKLDAPTHSHIDVKSVKLHEMASEFLAHLNKVYLSDLSESAYELKHGFINGTFSGALYRVHRSGLVTLEDEGEIENQLYKFGYLLSGPEAARVIHIIKQRLRDKPLCLEAVAPVSLANETKSSWAKLPFTLEEIGSFTLDDIPEFKDFLRRCGEGADSLVYFLGSVLDPESTRSQYVYLYGPGGDGKSALIKSLRSAMGPANVISIKEHLFNGTHFGEQLEGVRLVEFADENGTGFISSGRFKSLTGDETFEVNPKGKKHRHIVLTSKIIVTSNSRPEITAIAADERRLVPVEMAPDDSAADGRDFKWWYKGLVESGQRILGYCYARYLEAIESGNDVRSSIPVAGELVTEAARRKYEDVMDVIVDRYEVTGASTDKTEAKELYQYVISEARKLDYSKYIKKRVREALAQAGVEYKPTPTRHFQGVRLKSEAARERVNSKAIKPRGIGGGQ